MERPTEETASRVLSILRRHGRQTTSFQVLEPGYHYWFDDDACVAYIDTLRAWVAAGEPIAPRARLREVTQRFIADAEARKREVRFFAVGEDFARRVGLHSIHVGEQPIWDPHEWEDTLAGSRSLREQLRRARAKGIETRVVPAAELSDPSTPLRKRVDALIDRWIASRSMSEMQFMVLVHPFDHAEERRYVVAEQEDRVVGFAAAVPVFARDGWFVEDLLRDPEAPNGTTETLVDTTMRLLADEGSRYVTLGLAPLAGEVGTALRLTRDYSSTLYNFGGVRAFKEKLRPHEWEPVHLAFPHGHLGILALRDVLTAFAPGGLVRFGLNTLVHQRTLATFLLAVLLVPWTIALALVDPHPWFPSRGVQLAWVAFDVLLLVLLFSLVVRWRPRLASLLAVLTSADALLTLAQVLLFNVGTTPFGWPWLVVAVGLAGPFLAATFFWSTRVVSMRSELLARG